MNVTNIVIHKTQNSRSAVTLPMMPISGLTITSLALGMSPNSISSPLGNIWAPLGRCKRVPVDPLQLERVMQRAVRAEVLQILDASATVVTETGIPPGAGQAALCAAQVGWTQEVEEALSQQGLCR
jgi:hypothetical protein